MNSEIHLFKQAPIAFIISLLLLSIESSGADKTTKVANSNQKQSYVILEKITTELGDELSLIKIKFNQKPSIKNLSIINKDSFMQINLPNVVIPDPGNFVDLDHPFIPKVIFFQTSPKQAILRLFSNIKTSEAINYTSADIFHDNLIITYKDPKAKKDLAAKATAKASKKVAMDQDIQEEQIDDLELDELEPNLALTSTGMTEEEKFPLDLKLKFVAFISLALFLLMIAFLTLRRVWLGQTNQGLSSSGPGLKILQSISLAPKYRLSLVQVGQSKYLFSIGPEGVSMVAQPETPSQPHFSAPQTSTSLSKSTLLPLSKRESVQSKSFANHLESANSVQKKVPARRQKDFSEDQNDNISQKIKKNIQVKIDDQGIHQRKPKSNQKISDPAITKTRNKATEDVTKLIREKLKSLPKI